MGSTGSGRFSDYSGAESSGDGKSRNGGASGEDRCNAAFGCNLDDVGQGQYFAKHKSVPPAGTTLEIVLLGRVFAVDQNGDTVGALPTKFNYLAGCLADNFKYVGVVTKSAASPVPVVTADFSVK